MFFGLQLALLEGIMVEGFDHEESERDDRTEQSEHDNVAPEQDDEG